MVSLSRLFWIVARLQKKMKPTTGVNGNVSKKRWHWRELRGRRRLFIDCTKERSRREARAVSGSRDARTAEDRSHSMEAQRIHSRGPTG
ncbi:hypothetical protein CEXT_700971 [Caerostris extrusa]|uniref:Secreted protein n=1 Tax=Caerostris extrusa TaxID=172846 RepID=A0AAV4XBL2_CAEEX|nr:hypothetical protein CEXT_700971 [Caerostris extrusa]